MSQKSRAKSITNDVPVKRLKLDSNASALTEEEKERILKLIENEPEHEKFDEMSLKKQIIQLDKKVLRNQEMRMRYPDEPIKFMESEIELNDVIQDMHIIATRPDLYNLLLQTNGLQTLLGLLSHENSDIFVSVINLLQELTDVEGQGESVENVTQLIDALNEQQIITLLVLNLDRLDENQKDEAQGVYNALGIFENIFELKQDMCLEAAKQGLLGWLLKRIKFKVYDNNKLYSSEILSILVQNEDEIREQLGEQNGIDILLQQLAFYKKHNPSTQDELEYMENLFNTLCSCLMYAPNRQKFLEGEGPQLMRLMLREQKYSRNSALKILTYAMNGFEGKSNCTTFVDILGLGVLFPLFMKPPKGNRRAGETKSENEENLVSILTSLIQNCTGQHKERVLLKFIENDHEKVDRLIEIYFKYIEKVEIMDARLAKDHNDDMDEDDKADEYLERLDGGLFTLQQVAYMIIEISVNGQQTIKSRVEKLLNLRDASKERLKQIVREYLYDMFEDEEAAEKMKEERQRMSNLIEKF